MILILTEEFCVMEMENEAKLQDELIWQFKIT